MGIFYLKTFIPCSIPCHQVTNDLTLLMVLRMAGIIFGSCGQLVVGWRVWVEMVVVISDWSGWCWHFCCMVLFCAVDPESDAMLSLLFTITTLDDMYVSFGIMLLLSTPLHQRAASRVQHPNHVAANSLSPHLARKGSTLSGFVQRSRLEREVGRDLHSNKWEEVWSCIRQSGQSGEGCRGSPMEKRYETRSGD